MTASPSPASGFSRRRSKLRRRRFLGGHQPGFRRRRDFRPRPAVRPEPRPVRRLCVDRGQPRRVPGFQRARRCRQQGRHVRRLRAVPLGVNYALVSATAFLGETDIFNGIFNSNGGYDTQGYAVTGSVGHIFMLSRHAAVRSARRHAWRRLQRRRLHRQQGQPVRRIRDLVRRIQVRAGHLYGPPARQRHDLQPLCARRAAAAFRLRQHVEASARWRSASTTADFSAALSTGFNLKMSKKATMSGEIRGKLSSDSSTLGGKLGLKIAF